MIISILGYNDQDKASMIDQLEEYFEATEQYVEIDLYNEIDKMVNLCRVIRDTENWSEKDRVLFAHLLIATEGFFVEPEWDLVFYKPTAEVDDDLDIDYQHQTKELSLKATVVVLSRDVDEAADQVRALVEGL